MSLDGSDRVVPTGGVFSLRLCQSVSLGEGLECCFVLAEEELADSQIENRDIAFRELFCQFIESIG